MNTKLGSILRSAFETVKDGSTGISTGGDALKPGERRNTAVLFLDLAGFTRFSEILDHETVHDITKSIMDELVATAQKYAGYVDKIEGDRIMVLFGAVNSGENDCRRAVLCGFRMLEVLDLVCSLLRPAGVDLSGRIGISSGPVTVAPDAIGHLTAIGNTVNLASRMEELAELNTILVTDKVHSMCVDCAVWKPPMHLSVKGIDSPVKCWVPVERLRQSPGEDSGTGFIGRVKELALLAEVLTMVDNGATGISPSGGPRHMLLEITGEAGTGKARLVSEFLNRECGERLILRGKSIPDCQPAHWLWSSIISSVLGFHIQKSVSWNEFITVLSGICQVDNIEDSLPFLGRLIPASTSDPRLDSLGNQALALETRLAVRDFIVELSKNHPLVVVLEDTHWIDPTDLELLRFLLGNCVTEKPVLFILTGRVHGEDSPVNILGKDSLYSICRTVQLKELSMAECGRMAESISEKYSTSGENRFSDHAVEVLWKHSSGNPFFLRELVMHLIESQGIQQEDGIWRIADSSMEVSTPETLTGLLQSRLDNLPDEPRRTLLLCAVLGNEFLLKTYELVTLRLGIPPAEEMVFEEMRDRQMLVRADSGSMTGYRFKHPLIQTTAYHSNLSHNLKLIHKAAALSIRELFMNDEERISAKLASHWEGAEDLTEAAHWGIMAQKHASNNFQHTAVLFWGEKLEKWLPAESEDYMKVLELNSRAFQFTGRSGEQKEALVEMSRLAEQNDMPAWKARSLMDIGSLHRVSGEMDKALENLVSALSICRENGLEELESNTLGNLGVLAADRRQIQDAEKYFSSARDLHRKLGNKKGEASTLGNLGIMARNTGNTVRAVECFESALGIFREIGDISSEAITLGNLGNIHHDMKQFEIAQDLYTKALAIFVRTGDRNSQGIFQGNLGILFADQGRTEKALEAYQKAVSIACETGNIRSKGWALSNMGILMLENGDTNKADQLCGEALQIFQKIQDRRMAAITMGAVGYIKFLRGKIDDSIEYYRTTCDMVSEMKLPVNDFEKTLLRHRESIMNLPLPPDHLPFPGHWS